MSANLPRPFEAILAEPARCWVRWSPRRWPGPDGEFLDLSRGELAGDRFRDVTSHVEAGSFDDTVYLPLMAPAEAHRRIELARELVAGRTPVLVQLRPGEQPLPGVEAVFDVTESVLSADWQALVGLPKDSVVVWPLIAGLSDRPARWRDGLAALATAGVGTVQGIVPALTARDKRRLSDRGGETVFEALFHGSPPSRLEFAREAARHGLAPLMKRPSAGIEGRLGRNRRLAARLAETGEMLVLLGHPEGKAQAFYRAARRVDGSGRDFQAIAEEGNLDVVGWLEEEVRGEIEIALRGSSESLLDTLLAELGPNPK